MDGSDEDLLARARRQAMQLLALDALRPIARPPGDAQYEDARLVIDLTTDSGATETYYSGGGYLLSADSRVGRPIDDAFRRRFRCSGNPLAD